MSRQKHFFAISLTMLAIVMIAVGFNLFQLSSTMGELSVEMNRSRADAILASTSISNTTTVSVPVLYYSQETDECVNLYDLELRHALNARQFEWSQCGYYNTAAEADIVEPWLGEDLLPVATGGTLLPNRGIKEGFSRWFHAVDGKSKAHTANFMLEYDADSSSFVHFDSDFHPLDQKDNERSQLFTMNLAIPIQTLLDGKEEFEIYADDDTWVFIDDRLALDMGGIHSGMRGQFKITSDGEVYTAIGDEGYAFSGIRVSGDAGAIVRIFHADRNSPESVFEISFTNMLLNIVDSSLAYGDEAVVAYDPANPTYIPPLGETLTVRPDRSRAVLTAAIAEVAILGALMVMFVILISLVQRYSLRDHNPEQ